MARPSVCGMFRRLWSSVAASGLFIRLHYWTSGVVCFYVSVGVWREGEVEMKWRWWRCTVAWRIPHELGLGMRSTSSFWQEPYEIHICTAVRRAMLMVVRAV